MPAAVNPPFTNVRRSNRGVLAVWCVLQARNLLAEEPDPTCSNKCQEEVRVLPFLESSFDFE
jgi:hypothetical protein